MKIKKLTPEEVVCKYGRMNYSPDRIARLLGLCPEERSLFFSRINDPSDELCTEYQKGLAIADLKLDKALEKAGMTGNVDAIIELGKRRYHQKMDELVKNRFGSC